MEKYNIGQEILKEVKAKFPSFLIFRHHIPVLPNKETWCKGKKALPLHQVLFT